LWFISKDPLFTFDTTISVLFSMDIVVYIFLPYVSSTVYVDVEGDIETVVYNYSVNDEVQKHT